MKPCGRAHTHILLCIGLNDSLWKCELKAPAGKKTTKIQSRGSGWLVLISDREVTIAESAEQGWTEHAADWLGWQGSPAGLLHTHMGTLPDSLQRTVSVREQYPALCTSQLSTLINHHGDRATALTVRTPSHTHTHTYTNERAPVCRLSKEMPLRKSSASYIHRLSYNSIHF